MNIRIKPFLILNVFLFAISALSAQGKIIIEDSADLLSKEEEISLEKIMEPVSQYGGAAFVTNNQSYSGYASDLAQAYCLQYFNGDSGTVFLIDMYNRRIQIYSTGAIYKAVGKNWANSITDNVYTYATDGNYYECAAKAFSQIQTILEGGKISVPMRYVSSILLGIAAALLMMYLILWISRKKKMGSSVKTLNYEGIITKNARQQKNVEFVDKVMTKETKVTHSAHSAGGGISIGGFSGGGGGHGF